MDLKSLMVAGVGLTAAALFIAPQADPGDPAHVAAFKVECQRGLGGSSAAPFCRCMANGIESRMNTPDEFHLAGGIIRAIGQTQSAQNTLGTDMAFNQHVLEIKFDRLSAKFKDTISADRKQNVLDAVTGEVSVCERDLPRQ